MKRAAASAHVAGTIRRNRNRWMVVVRSIYSRKERCWSLLRRRLSRCCRPACLLAPRRRRQQPRQLGSCWQRRAIFPPTLRPTRQPPDDARPPLPVVTTTHLEAISLLPACSCRSSARRAAVAMPLPVERDHSTTKAGSPPRCHMFSAAAAAVQEMWRGKVGSEL